MAGDHVPRHTSFAVALTTVMPAQIVALGLSIVLWSVVPGSGGHDLVGTGYIVTFAFGAFAGVAAMTGRYAARHHRAKPWVDSKLPIALAVAVTLGTWLWAYILRGLPCTFDSFGKVCSPTLSDRVLTVVSVAAVLMVHALARSVLDDGRGRLA